MKRFIFAAVSTALLSCLAGCDVEPSEYSETESQAPRFELHGTNINSIQVITDNQTGVQYLKYKRSGMTPLLNSDGSLLLDGEVGGPLP